MKGLLFDIKHFAVHDGPGIRTTVFFKGCPLKCRWCHNPESLSVDRQLSWLAHKCMDCGNCVSLCPQGAHQMDAEGKHRLRREKCTLCGGCVSACPGKLLTLYGSEWEVEEVLRDVLRDRDFYECSKNGGITLSGGECLLQPEFCRELLQGAKREGLHTAVDTCGFVSRRALELVLPHTDLFLYDLKAVDPEVHRRCTGQENRVILENLQFLIERDAAIEIRIPYVPGWNSGEVEKMGALLSGKPQIKRVKVLPYHNYAGTKYHALDMEDTLPGQLPEDRELEEAKALLRGYGLMVAD